MSDDFIVQSDLPVASVDDVAAEWSPDLYDPAAVQPLLQAIMLGQAAMLTSYQDASETAAAQSDPLRATDEYEDEIGWELAVHRQPAEDNDSYRSRFFYESTVSPEDLIAAANTALAPFTDTSCVYFEHLDGWHTRNDFLDVVAASNASPIVVKTRYLPPYFTAGTLVTVTGVAGNTNANGTFQAQVVLGAVIAIPPFSNSSPPPTVTVSGTPTTSGVVTIGILTPGARGVAAFYYQVNGVSIATLQTAASVPLPGTGLIAAFANSTFQALTVYQVEPIGLSLTGTTGSGDYTGGGSLVLPADDSSQDADQWSSHVYDSTSYATPNYPDRHYGSLPHRFPGGARAFSDAKGRLFWLLAPDISGIDNNVAGLFDGYLDIVGMSNTSPIEVTTAFPLPAELVTGATVRITGASVAVALSGGATFHVTHGSTTVTATGSAFTTELSTTALSQKNRIFFGGTTAADHYEVAAIGSNTSFTLGEAYKGTTSTTATGFTYNALFDETQPYAITVTGPSSFTLNGTSAAGTYAGGGSVQTSVTYSADGFFAGAGITLIGSVSVSHGTTTTLDATHALGLVHSATGTTHVVLPTSPTGGNLVAVQDVDGVAGSLGHAILVTASGGVPFENPNSPGSFVLAVFLSSNFIEAIWVYDGTNSRWKIAPGESYVWSIASTAADVYNALVANVNAIRGQSIRWFCWVDPKL